MGELTEVPGHRFRRHGREFRCTCGTSFAGSVRAARGLFVLHKFDIVLTLVTGVQ